jgi:NADH-quinone oxidoreductase subunit N
MPDLRLDALLPYLVVAGGGLLVMLADAAFETRTKGHLAFLTQIVLVVAGLVLVVNRPAPGPVLGGMLVTDLYTRFFHLVFLACGLVTVIYAAAAFDREGEHRAEFYPLILFAILGMMVLAAANDLLSLFLGLETMSLAVYVLVCGRRFSIESGEAALKYLLLGSFAAAVLLMGMALVYGFAGGTGYPDLAAAMHRSAGHPLLLSVGLGLMLIGFGFKIAVVPFHMWTPDVYDGAPAHVTGFMATAVKAAAFSALLRFAVLTGGDLAPVWFNLLAVLAVVTMTVGNLLALVQNHMKRLLAYSSIAHAGYLLLGVLALLAPSRVAGDAAQAQTVVGAAGGGVLFYLVGYCLMNLAAFGVISQLGRRGGDDANRIDGYSGLARRQPVAAAVLAVCMLSLAGIPGTVGFMGKFYIFDAVMQAGLVPLAIWGVVNSLLSVYYYLHVIVVMYMQADEEESYDSRNWESVSAAALLAIAVVLLGILPGGMHTLASMAFGLMKM